MIIIDYQTNKKETIGLEIYCQMSNLIIVN